MTLSSLCYSSAYRLVLAQPLVCTRTSVLAQTIPSRMSVEKASPVSLFYHRCT